MKIIRQVLHIQQNNIANAPDTTINIFKFRILLLTIEDPLELDLVRRSDSLYSLRPNQ